MAVRLGIIAGYSPLLTAIGIETGWPKPLVGFGI